MTESKLEPVKQAYRMLVKDDYDSFLQLCAPDAEVEYPAANVTKYGGLWRGHDGILKFFRTHDGEEEILDVQLKEYLGKDDRVFVLGTFRGRAIPTGRVWETKFVHVLTVRNQKIQRLKSYYDTAAAVAAHCQ